MQLITELSVQFSSTFCVNLLTFEFVNVFVHHVVSLFKKTLGLY